MKFFMISSRTDLFIHSNILQYYSNPHKQHTEKDFYEAALDDSNVGRFAGYLQKLTKNTQFIIITHRRGTMNAADRLYGITMQEKGVSTLVSVDLVENQLTQ